MRTGFAGQKRQRTLDTSGKGCHSRLCHYWELQTRKWAGSSLRGGSWHGMKSIPRHTTYHGTVGYMETPVLFEDHFTSRPHKVVFYDMPGEGCLPLPRSSTVHLLDLHPEAGHTFAPFGSIKAHCGIYKYKASWRLFNQNHSSGQ